MNEITGQTTCDKCGREYTFHYVVNAPRNRLSDREFTVFTYAQPQVSFAGYAPDGSIVIEDYCPFCEDHLHRLTPEEAQ